METAGCSINIPMVLISSPEGNICEVDLNGDDNTVPETNGDSTQVDPFNETGDSEMFNQNEFREATNAIREDIAKNLFCDTVEGKRTGKCKLLKEELSDNSVYKNKQ